MLHRPGLRSLRSCVRLAVFGLAGLAVLPLHAQEERHGRKYKPLPPTAVVTVTVEKAFNGKPLPNAAVVFQTTRDGKSGNLEVKTDPDGNATIDILEVGSHIKLQVFAPGFASYATEFDVATADKKDLLVKLLRPREQVSAYRDDTNKPAEVQPGLQNHQTGPKPPVAPATTPQMQSVPPTETPVVNKPPVAQPQQSTTQGPPLV